MTQRMSELPKSLSQKKELLAGTALGLILGIVLFITNPALHNFNPTPRYQPTDNNRPALDAILPGSVAPDFKLIDAVTNRPVTLSQFYGKPVILNFWATWCGPCKVEMPHLQDAHNSYSKEHLIILAINYGEDPTTVLSFASDLGLTFRTLLDETAAIQSQYQVRGYPTTIFVNTDGTISHTHIGMLEPSLLIHQIDELLAK
ncbi:MAG: TlpA disulfide reductase family protein [Anaerolineales bacterium]|nr:TlpA disulfide reductase family protein [Anaerolineales bacterium]